MDSLVWNGSNVLLPEGKAVGEMISWVPSIPTVYESGSGPITIHAGGLAKVKTSPLPHAQDARSAKQNKLLESSLIKY